MKKVSIAIGILSILSVLLTACGQCPTAPVTEAPVTETFTPTITYTPKFTSTFTATFTRSLTPSFTPSFTPTRSPVEMRSLPPLLCYSLGDSASPDVNTTFQTKSQFGEERNITLRSLDLLCEPVAKAETREEVGKLPPVNPLACYSLQEGSEPVDQRVTLNSANNIFAGEVDVRARRLFCDPVYSKTVWEKPADNKQFEFPLLFYEISPVEPQGIETVIYATDQFIEVQEIPLSAIDSLAEPVIKVLGLEEKLKDPPEDVNPYVCFFIYQGGVRSLDLSVVLEDQFHSEPFEVKVDMPVVFCDPAVKKME